MYKNQVHRVYWDSFVNLLNYTVSTPHLKKKKRLHTMSGVEWFYKRYLWRWRWLAGQWLYPHITSFQINQQIHFNSQINKFEIQVGRMPKLPHCQSCPRGDLIPGGCGDVIQRGRGDLIHRRCCDVIHRRCCNVIHRRCCNVIHRRCCDVTRGGCGDINQAVVSNIIQEVCGEVTQGRGVDVAQGGADLCICCTNKPEI